MNYCKGCKYAGLDGMDCYSCSAGSNYVPNELEPYKKENEKIKNDWEEAKKKGLDLLNLRAIRITELEKENKEILEDNDTLNKWVDELKEQIEKMKCCENCRYYSRTYEHCYSYDSYQNCKSLSNWRLAE